MSAVDILAPIERPGAGSQTPAGRPGLLGGAALFAGLLQGEAGSNTATAATRPTGRLNATAGLATALPLIEEAVETDVPADGAAQLLNGAALFVPVAAPAPATPATQASPATASPSANGLPTGATTPAQGAAVTTDAAAATTQAPNSAAGAIPEASTNPAPATPSAAAAAQAVAQASTTGVAGALAVGETLGQLRQQGQVQEGQRRTERQDSQKAPSTSSAVASTSLAAVTPSGAPAATSANPAASQTQAPPTDLAPQPPADTPAAPTLDAPTADPSASDGAAPTETAPSPTPAPRESGPLGLARSTIETTAMLAAQIIRRLDQRSTRFEMALTPEGLGRVDVSMEIDSDGRLAARMAFDNPVASLELRARADELRRQLEQAGFTLADDALDFAERDGGASGQAFDRGPDTRSRRAFAGARDLAAQADGLMAGERLTLSLTPSGVDMKV